MTPGLHSRGRAADNLSQLHLSLLMSESKQTFTTPAQFL